MLEAGFSPWLSRPTKGGIQAPVAASVTSNSSTPLPSQRLCYTSRCENHQFKSSFDRTEIANPMRWTIKPFTFIHQHPRQHHHLMSTALKTKKLLSFFPCARHRMTSLTTQSYLIVLRNLPQSTTTTSEIQGPAREIQVSHRPGRLLGACGLASLSSVLPLMSSL